MGTGGQQHITVSWEASEMNKTRSANAYLWLTGSVEGVKKGASSRWGHGHRNWATTHFRGGHSYSFLFLLSKHVAQTALSTSHLRDHWAEKNAVVTWRGGAASWILLSVVVLETLQGKEWISLSSVVVSITTNYFLTPVFELPRKKGKDISRVILASSLFLCAAFFLL